MPEADTLIAILLAVLVALAVVVIGWRMTIGPMPTRWLNFLWHFERTYCRLWHRLRWAGVEHIPADGPVIIAANHTTGLDPFLIQAPSRRLIKWVMIENYRYRILDPVWNAIDPIVLRKDGSQLESVRAVIRALQAGQVVGLFPEGALQRASRELKPFQPGIGLIAQRSGATIVPCWIAGTPRTRHMFWHFARPSRSVVIFGPPYQPDADASHEQVAEDLRRRMLELAQRL